MTGKMTCERGVGRLLAISFLSIAGIVGALMLFGRPVRQFVRDAFLRHVTSAHYEILWRPGLASAEAMSQFAQRRESLFAALDRKLGDAGSNATIRIIFDPGGAAQRASESSETPYSVSKTTIRTRLSGQTPELFPAADAEALLYTAWGKPGSPQIARWVAVSLVGGWRGAEIGMAAAQVEQKLGHKRIATLLAGPPGEFSSPDDRDLLGGAWISEIAEFGGPDAVRKLYAAKMPRPSVGEVTRVLGTTPSELDRKWQLWMYAYLAGMPSSSGGSSMPTDMPMPGGR